MDSNSKILDLNRLWDCSKTKLVKTYTLDELERNVSQFVSSKTECIYLNISKHFLYFLIENFWSGNYSVITAAR